MFLTVDCHRYLKHVVIKFICSRGDEALQLVRAISVLLELSPQEEKHIKEYLDYKVERETEREGERERERDREGGGDSGRNIRSMVRYGRTKFNIQWLILIT